MPWHRSFSVGCVHFRDPNSGSPQQVHYLVRDAVGILVPVNEERRIAGIFERFLFGWRDLPRFCLVKPHGDESLLACASFPQIALPPTGARPGSRRRER